VLADGDTALLLEPGTVEDRGAAIVKLADAEGLRRHLGERAREVAVKNHTWAHNAARVLKTYEEWTGFQDVAGLT
jgi:glycosyltransferase involved in cell wall biosynthesis